MSIGMARIVEPINIIGLGCAGVRVARSFDELGTERIGSVIHFWDGDTVKQDNIRAQLYRPTHLKWNKVDAAREIASKWSGLKIESHHGYVTSDVSLRGIVFLCVDTMQSRDEIWKTAIKGNKAISLMIELRLGTASSVIHVVDPNEEYQQDMWEHYWYPDSEVETRGSCGAATSLGPIANLTADLAVWQVVRYAQVCAGSTDRLDNQLQIEMHPPSVRAYAW